MINWKRLGGKRPWPSVWMLYWHLPRGTDNNHNTSYRIVGVLAEIRSRHNLNISTERYGHTLLSADLTAMCIIFQDNLGLDFC
jgi:hypothetical protein